MSGFYWIASYPKSGNTWVRLALSALIHADTPSPSMNGSRFAPNASRRSDIEDGLDVETGDLTPDEVRALRPAAYRALAQTSKHPLFRKVHDAWSATETEGPLFPPEATLGTIHIVRDPRDVAVSWAHFAAIDVDAAIAILCDPSTIIRPHPPRVALTVPQWLSCWSGHARSWMDAPGRPGCLLRYEDLLADPATALARIATYAGIPHDETRIRNAIDATRFDALRRQEVEHGFNGGQAPGRAFFRAGRSGDWRHLLSDEQVERICTTHREMMQRLGYNESGCS